MNEDPGGKFGDVKFFSVEFNDENKVTFTYLVGAVPCAELFGPMAEGRAYVCARVCSTVQYNLQTHPVTDLPYTPHHNPQALPREGAR
jgi:hypothetical protein